MKKFFLGMTVGLLLVFIGGFGYLSLGLADVRSDVSSSNIKTSLMHMAVHASVRRNAPDVSNPVQLSDETLIAGGKHYLDDCAGCHGTPGKPQKFSGGLTPPAPQFPTEGTEYTEAQAFWVIKNGIRRSGMFVNGLSDSDLELWKVAAFVKHMNQLSPKVKAELFK